VKTPAFAQDLHRLLQESAAHLDASDPVQAAAVVQELTALIRVAEARAERLNPEALEKARILQRRCSEAAERCQHELILKMQQAATSSRAISAYEPRSSPKHR
jgi:hypothetical protein